MRAGATTSARSIRLSGEFHALLAELAGNSALARSMRELSVLTCLIIFLYDAPTEFRVAAPTSIRRSSSHRQARRCAPSG